MLQKPTHKSRRDGEVRMMSHGALVEIRGDYSKEEILDKARLLIEEESGYSPEYWRQHARWSQSWYKAVPDGSGEYTWVARPRDTPCQGAYFASVLYLY